MPAHPHGFRNLQPERIVETIALLERRIQERFPDSGLSRVAAELHRISGEAVVRTGAIQRPNYPLRLLSGLLVVGILVLLTMLVRRLRLDEELLEFEHFVQALEAALGSLVFVGAALLSLVTIETRIKRRRALTAIHELRALAHIVDMHQLTKDPERVTGRGPSTLSSPKRTMSPFLLARYLDYCSELLSLVSKVGAIYVQEFPDPVALEAVGQLANLTNGLARNIWQKIMILDIAVPRAPAAVDTPSAAAGDEDRSPPAHAAAPPPQDGPGAPGGD